MIKLLFMRPILLLIMLTAFLFCASQQHKGSGGKLNPAQAIMDVKHYTVALTLNIPQKTISGYTEIDAVFSESAPTILLDLVDSFNVQKIWVNGKQSPFTYKDDMLTITPATAVTGKCKIKVQYNGQPHIAIRPPWEDGFTWATDSLGKPWIAVTSVGTGAKLFFPCKDHPSDEPDEGADMLITVPKDLAVAGPGLLVNVSKKKNEATYHWKTIYPINNYCIVFNVGNYEVVTKPYTTVNGNTVPMQFYVLKYNASKADHHLDLLRNMLSIREKYFGEYPWIKEKVGVAETPHLGMEHQSMNAYGNKFKYTKVGGQDYDWLMDHELGHEWWGNQVTAKDWAHYWIHEGIGTYGDALYVRDMEGEEAYIKRFKQSLPSFANEKPIVQGDDIDEETAYIGDIYSKGAFFMHTLRYVIGDEAFFPALKQLATSPEYRLTNTNAVTELFSKASKTDLKPLFDLFLRTTNKLEIQVRATRGGFKVQLLNYEGSLPLDIVTEKGKERKMVDKKGIMIATNTQPLIDPDMYYMKKVIIE